MMKRLAIAVLLMLTLPASAQYNRPSTSTSTYIWAFKPTAVAPPVAETGVGKIYLDPTCGCLKWSYSGSVWANLYTPGLVYVATFNGRTQAVVPANGDYTATQVTNTPAGAVAGTTVQSALNELDTEKAPLASPTFTGTVTVPSPFTLGATSITVTGTEINRLAGVASNVQTQIDAKAPLASPALTGTPSAPTAAVDTNTTQIATTAYVVGQAYLKSATAASTYETQAAHAADVSTINAAIALKAPLASPTFTGTVTAPSITGGITPGTASTSTTIAKSGIGSSVAVQVQASAAADRALMSLSAGDGTTSGRFSFVDYIANETTPQRWRAGMNGTKDFVVRDETGTRTPISIAQSDGTIILTAPSAAAVFMNTGYARLRHAAAGNTTFDVQSNGAANNASIGIMSGDGTTSSRFAVVSFASSETVPQSWATGMYSSKNWVVRDDTAGRTPISIAQTDGLVSIANGLSVTSASGNTFVAITTVADAVARVHANSATHAAQVDVVSGNATTSSRNSFIRIRSSETATQEWRIGMEASKNFSINDTTAGKSRIVLRQDVPGLVGINGSPSAGTLDVRPADGSVAASVAATAPNTTGAATVRVSSGDGTTSARAAYLDVVSSETSTQRWIAGMNGTKNFVVTDITGSRTPISVAQTDGGVTFSARIGVGVAAATGLERIKGYGTDASEYLTIENASTTGASIMNSVAGNGTTSSRNSYLRLFSNETITQEWRAGMQGDKTYRIRNQTASRDQMVFRDDLAYVGINATPSYHLDVQDATASATVRVRSSAAATNAIFRAEGGSGTSVAGVILSAGDGTTSNRNAYTQFVANETSSQTWNAGMVGSKDWRISDATGARVPLSIAQTDGLVTFANGLDASTGDQRVKGYKLQAFTLRIVNTAGVIQHSIFATSTAFATTITGATATLANTPTVDAATPFVSGGGLMSGATENFVFDTATAQGVEIIGVASVEFYSAGATGTAAPPLPLFHLRNINVNGTTITRPAIGFYNSLSAAWNLTTANLAAGKEIRVKFLGYIK
jgi:hypothetical protein